MSKYPSVTCTLPEYAAWVRWWCRTEERRVLAGNRAANPQQVRQSIGLLSDAMGRWLQTAEDFAKVCCHTCGATGLSKLRGKNGKKLPCSKCEGHGFIIPKEQSHEGKESAGRPRLQLAGPEDSDEEDEPVPDGELPEG